MTEVTPKTIVESIEKELNWGAEKVKMILLVWLLI